jgi:hypothetical protein
MNTHLCNDLMEAVLYNHDECVERLIVTGADPNVTDITGWLPLHYASSGGHDACVKKLIEAGADVEVVNAYGHTPLHCAAWKGRDTVCKTLVAAGANPNVVNSDGNTPLHQAVCNGYDTVCKTLVMEGGNPDVVNGGGKTPLQRAVEYTVNYADIYGYNKKCVDVLVECILAERALRNDEWDIISTVMNIGPLLPVVMTRYGRDASAKLVSKLPEEKRKVLENAMMCLSRLVSHDLVDRIAVQCV